MNGSLVFLLEAIEAVFLSLGGVSIALRPTEIPSQMVSHNLSDTAELVFTLLVIGGCRISSSIDSEVFHAFRKGLEVQVAL